jgi:hypothetical protein
MLRKVIKFPDLENRFAIVSITGWQEEGAQLPRAWIVRETRQLLILAKNYKLLKVTSTRSKF